jgi:nucleoid-associated protein YgaU
VKPGETLALIASRTLGDERLWPAIYAANRDRIKDPTRVYPGQQLAIPALSAGEREAARKQAEARPLRVPDVGAP